ncbi:hypothetical protein GCM10007111_32390 [Virgibacillus kapii]|uniref:Uncharacterized protein n=1 Tax=Virgibacillus kapii TaxID=1638645 RepID=A0ABQ2DR15_9BACI|nr:hypothetical protein GCM10007111_32390 [Virgibacillus kapii]
MYNAHGCSGVLLIFSITSKKKIIALLMTEKNVCFFILKQYNPNGKMSMNAVG